MDDLITNDNIVITKADKDGQIVILHKNNYVNSSESLMNGNQHTQKKEINKPAIHKH